MSSLPTRDSWIKVTNYYKRVQFENYYHEKWVSPMSTVRDSQCTADERRLPKSASNFSQLKAISENAGGCSLTSEKEITKENMCNTLKEEMLRKRKQNVRYLNNSSNDRSNISVFCRRDLTETLIANKREKDARREENWKNTQKYFNRCDFETKLHHQWNKARYMKSSKNPSAFNKAPFDMDFDSLKDKGFQVEVENEKKQILEKLSAMVSNIEKLEAQAFEAKLLTATVTEKMIDLLKTRKSLMIQRDVWTIKENKILYMRFSADKLRHKGHLICQQLCFYKNIIVSLSEIAENLLTKEEKTEMSVVVDGGLKIIQMYLAINYRRNTEFTHLYQEEAECQWLLQKDEWIREKEVWKDLVDKSLDVFFTLLKDKLEASISKEKELLQKREQCYDLLTAVVEDLKDNPYLNNLLTMSIKDLVGANDRSKTYQ